MTIDAFWLGLGILAVVCGLFVFALLRILDLQRHVTRLNNLIDSVCTDLTALEKAHEFAANNAVDGVRPQIVLVMPSQRPRL